MNGVYVSRDYVQILFTPLILFIRVKTKVAFVIRVNKPLFDRRFN